MLKFTALSAAVACLLVSGCRTLGPEPKPEPKPMATNAPPEEPRIRPLDASVGRVLKVDERLRFVVLDYSLYQLPAQGQVLTVEREGVDIGELKVNGPVRDTTVSADIVRGELKPGDRARPKR